MDLIKNLQAFFALVRAGLWEKETRLSLFGEIDFKEIYRLAEEQSVVGLVAAGLEHVNDMNVPKADTLQFVGRALQLEQQNVAMNQFIEVLIQKMRAHGIYAILVKGQGIAQCYEKPLWRACGDVDFLLDDDNYQKAKAFLGKMAEAVEQESGKHLGMKIGPWVVELHGNLHGGLSSRMDELVDDVQRDVFFAGNVRSWMNGKTQVFLPGVDNDVIFIFTHFLKHFYKGGLGLRQICDWCRLLWTYRTEIDPALLEMRLRKMRLMSEWKAFGAFAVEYLGMPVEALPLYDGGSRWKRKAKRILSFILMSGNFGHNRDNTFRSKPFLIRKTYSMCRRIGDVFNHARIFPLDSIRFLPSLLMNGVKSAAQRIG